MLVLNNIEVVYQQVLLVLKGVSLEVPRGGVVSLIGANGSGKSTILRTVSGLLVPLEGRLTRGSVSFQGRAINGLGPEEIVRLGLVQVMQGRRVFENLTVQENLVLGAGNRGKAETRQDLERIYHDLPLLAELRGRVSGYLSGGEQQLLVMARALMPRPRMLLLDEPLLGLSPEMSAKVLDLIQRVNAEQGISVLLVEQNALAALEISAYGYILENGRVVADGPSERLRQDPDVREFYLGLGHKNRRINYQEVKHYHRRKRWLS